MPDREQALCEREQGEQDRRLMREFLEPAAATIFARAAADWLHICAVGGYV